MHPLPMHPNAMPAAEAAMAANAQGKFLEMDRKLFENQQKLSRENYLIWAKELGLDVDKFTKDLDAHTYAEAIQSDSKEAEAIGASGTPASFVNGRYLSGAKPFAAFKEIIDEELAWAKSGKRPEFKVGKNVSEASAKPAATATGPDPNKVYTVRTEGSPAKGSPTAPIVIAEFSDFQ